MYSSGAGPDDNNFAVFVKRCRLLGSNLSCADTVDNNMSSDACTLSGEPSGALACAPRRSTEIATGVAKEVVNELVADLYISQF
jgi:hypothetical protein